MKDSNLRFPRSKQGGIAASPMRDKFGGGPGYRTLVVMMLARQHRRPRLPPIVVVIVGLEPTIGCV